MMYFFDTYAIIEIINGKPAYAQFQQEQIITSLLNFGELYYIFLKEFGKVKTENLLNNFKPDFIELDAQIVRRAMEFRWNNIKKKFSMVDCIGYALAQKKRLIFLTGDGAFEGFAGVEFVK